MYTDILYLVIGAVLGFFVSIAAWLFTNKYLVPKIKFANKISKIRSKDNPDKFEYRIRLENAGKRDIVDLHVYALVRIVGLEENKEISQLVTLLLSENYPTVIVPCKSESNYGIRQYRIEVNNCERFKETIYGKDINEKYSQGILTLEDLLLIKDDVTVHFAALGTDRLSGTRKYIESEQPYTYDSISYGDYEGMGLNIEGYNNANELIKSKNMGWLNKNKFCLLALAISLITLCLFLIRFEPFEFDSGSVVGFVASLMGVCATIIVGFQIVNYITYHNELNALKKHQEELKKHQDELEKNQIKLNIDQDKVIKTQEELNVDQKELRRSQEILEKELRISKYLRNLLDGDFCVGKRTLKALYNYTEGLIYLLESELKSDYYSINSCLMRAKKCLDYDIKNEEGFIDDKSRYYQKLLNKISKIKKLLSEEPEIEGHDYFIDCIDEIFCGLKNYMKSIDIA